jgi:tetratricopeptide (TPR) repeat protein
VSRLRRARGVAEQAEPKRPGLRTADILALTAVCIATALGFAGVADNELLNWDDQAALVKNTALDGDGVAGWAFSTTHMAHYQPLSWLAWALTRRAFGPAPAVHHVLSLALHVANAALVFVLAFRLASLTKLGAAPRRVAALFAAILFAAHPLRVEPVAWASGLPYVLALTPLLLSVILYVRHATASGVGTLLLGSLLCYGASLLSRAYSPGFPLVLLAIDFALGRLPRVGWTRILVEKLPFAVLAASATVAEGAARRFAPLERVGVAERASEAALAPFLYLYRTLWPRGLTPLHPLSLEPTAFLPALAVGVALLAVVSAWAYRLRATRPWLLAGWLSYLLLLGPALGLLPSGLQATADRYTYLPSVALALLAGAGAALLWEQGQGRATLVAIGAMLSIAMLGLTWRQVRFWRDSVTLWTRALAVDPANDVALYNLALALDARGDSAGAEAQYRRLLEVVPDHDVGRRNLELLEAARLEREGNEQAAAGHLAEAAELYSRALQRDAARLHARRSRGMALAQLGRYEEAIPDLAEAARAPDAEASVSGALAFALAETGRREEARATLQSALARHPGERRLATALTALESNRPK